MSTEYKPEQIEPKWRTKWDESQLYRQTIDRSKEKYYAMTMLPYPSGNLHIGHWYAMAPSDARARFMRMKGYNVMFPMGFDAFGLPAENAAIKHNMDPRKWTYSNIEHMRGQLRTMGTMFDWEREMVSCDPEYYRWSQWFFIKMFENDLAYRKMSAVDFCPSCNTTLAREQVWGEDRHCERCGTPVIKKDLEQWFFTITDYADELLDFSTIDWPERVKTMQTNWIGRSEGAKAVFKTEAGHSLEIFTTRPDTLWGATFMVMAPEHPLVDSLVSDEQRDAVDQYIDDVARLSDIDRESTTREKTGVFTGGYAINPVNGAKIPVWIADYVLMGYGTGAIMAVPAHDQRDFEFARQFGLDIVPVIQPAGEEPLNEPDMTEAYVGPGQMINSGPLDGVETTIDKGRKNPSVAAAIDWLAENDAGSESVNYRLRDWLISRQRFWGTPIPMIYCDECGVVPVPEEELPVLLPEDVDFAPTGESPLKTMTEWNTVTCPQCNNGQARRETDTMDTFMCSAWYQYRYLSPHFEDAPFDPEEGAYWLPVDQYTGGIEHATMHLIYTRFFTMAMKQLGLVDFSEPFMKLNNQGMVLGEDGEKMSKSRGNVVAPDELVDQYGADTVRTYLMFFSRWEQGGPWNYDGIKGSQRLIHDVWSLGTAEYAADSADVGETKALRRKTHQVIQKVTQDIDGFAFNTAIAAMMDLRNVIIKAQADQNASVEAMNEAVDTLLKLLAPIAPHITEELWERRGHSYSIHTEAWPVADEAVAREEEITLIVQLNGKVRDRIQVPVDVSEADAKAAALASGAIQEKLNGAEPRKVIYVPGRLVNIVG